MKFESRLEEKIGREPGFRLPEGSLEKAYVAVAASLPERKAARKVTPGVWQRVRPYIYMAAMFAGIWCMMKVFHSATTADISLDNPPELVAEAAGNAYYSDEYATESELKDFELEADVCEQYDDINDFERDFGYELKPEYSNAKVADAVATAEANTHKN